MWRRVRGQRYLHSKHLTPLMKKTKPLSVWMFRIKILWNKISMRTIDLRNLCMGFMISKNSWPGINTSKRNRRGGGGGCCHFCWRATFFWCQTWVTRSEYQWNVFGLKVVMRKKRKQSKKPECCCCCCCSNRIRYFMFGFSGCTVMTSRRLRYFRQQSIVTLSSTFALV
jgi:hypothetical protein